jgi:hypothetical protein
MELEQLESQIVEKRVELSILDQQIKQRQLELEWSGTKQEYVIRQLLAAIQTVLERPIYRGYRRCERSSYVPEIQTALTRTINDRIDDLIAISQVRLSNRQIKDYSHLTKESSFAPVPPPLLDADQIMKNGKAVPNQSGIYFIWSGPVVAYVGQSINLAWRLLGHERLRRGDKISYLCIDSNELFYHEAFYIGICRPSRNSNIMKDL